MKHRFTVEVDVETMVAADGASRLITAVRCGDAMVSTRRFTHRLAQMGLHIIDVRAEMAAAQEEAERLVVPATRIVEPA